MVCVCVCACVCVRACVHTYTFMLVLYSSASADTSGVACSNKYVVTCNDEAMIRERVTSRPNPGGELDIWV